MKRIICFLIMCLMVAPAIAATTCIHTRTAVFTIKKGENATSHSVDTDENTFTLNFGYDLVPNNSSYRSLTGAATCNEVSTDTAGGAITMGGANTHLRSSTADVGNYCWCSLTGPVTSWWTFLKTYDDEDTCASSCVRDCAVAIANDTDKFRSGGVYLAIW